jgi:hypothetical protein
VANRCAVIDKRGVNKLMLYDNIAREQQQYTQDKRPMELPFFHNPVKPNPAQDDTRENAHVSERTIETYE